MAGLPLVTAFEIRLYKVDASLSVVMKINALSADDARAQAVKMLKADLVYAIVWQGLNQIGTVHRDKPN